MELCGWGRVETVDEDTLDSWNCTDSQDLDKIKRTLDEFFSVKLEIRDISLKGWNWGELQVQGG